MKLDFNINVAQAKAALKQLVGDMATLYAKSKQVVINIVTKINGQSLKQGAQQVKRVTAGVTNSVKNAATKAGQAVKNSAKKLSTDVKDTATETAKQTDNASEKSTSAIKKLINSMKGLDGKFKSSLNEAKTFASGLISKFTLIVLAVEMATKAFTYFFENLTQSIPKLVTKMQNMVKIAQKNKDSFKKEKEASDNYLTTLKKLSQKQNLSNTQQLLAQAIIEKLTKKYKGLSLSIDQTTGAIIGLSQALPLIQNQDREQQIRLLREQISAQKSLVNAKFAETFGNSKIQLGKKVNGKDFFSFAQNVFGSQFTPFAESMAKAFNTGNLDNIIKVMQNISMGTYSESISKNITGVLDALYKLKELNTNLGDYFDPLKTVIKNTGDLLDDIEKLQNKVDDLKGKTQNVVQKTQQNAAKHAYDELKTPQQRAEAIQKEIDDLNEQLKQTQKDIESSKKKEFDYYSEGKRFGSNTLSLARAIDQRKAEQQQLIRINKQNKSIAENKLKELNPNLQQDYIRRQGKTWKQVLDRLVSGDQPMLNDERRQEAIKQVKIIIDAEEALASTRDLNKQIADLQNQLEANQRARTEASKSGAKTAVETAQLELKSAQLQSELQQKTFELQKQQEAIQQERLKRQKAISDIYTGYQTQLDNLHKSTRQITLETALANAEKAKGIALTEQQVRKITQYVDMLEHAKQIEEEQNKTQRQQDAINNIFSNYEQSQTIAYLKLIGLEKESVLLEARLNAEKAKGAKLTEEQLKSLQNYVDVQQMIDEATKSLKETAPKLSLYSSGIISNQLARKGGFASSVVTDRAQDINKQILGQQRKQYDVTSKIKDAIEKYSVIQ